MQPRNFPPDFTDEACYLAYLRAVANGQVRIHGQDQAEAQAMARAELTGQAYATSAPAANPRFNGGGDCIPHLTHDGTWETCNGFLGLAVLRATPATKQP